MGLLINSQIAAVEVLEWKIVSSKNLPGVWLLVSNNTNLMSKLGLLLGAKQLHVPMMTRWKWDR